MHIRLKGLNRVSKRLADGRRVNYYYAWKGGPRLPGKPGDPEFIAAYNEAVSARVERRNDTLQSILYAYQASPRFTDLSAPSRRDYTRQITRIEAEFGDFPLAALTDRRTRGEFLAWRDRLAVNSRRQADYAFSVLALILAWAFDRGLVSANPCQRPGKLYRSTRIENIWTEADCEEFFRCFPAVLHLPFQLALWTGQRQGDLLRLTWNDFDGHSIRLRQSKTGARVRIPLGAPIKDILEVAPKRAVTVLTNSKGQPWKASSFQTAWQRAMRNSNLSGLTFHDLRGTAVTRLAQAGCEVPEIASITGHSLRDVGSILDAHYLNRDYRTARSAIHKLEVHQPRGKQRTVTKTNEH
ncbi:MAG: tyrosine-type recombinase/integrase [Pseudomonadota bacterium]